MNPLVFLLHWHPQVEGGWGLAVAV